jgi:hypothetical protein
MQVVERSNRSNKPKNWKVVWWLAAFVGPFLFGGSAAAILAHHEVTDEYLSVTQYDTLDEYRSYQSQQFWQYGSMCGFIGLTLAGGLALTAKNRS